MFKRECYESRKNCLDDIRLNPKCCLHNRKSAAKLQIGERSTTIPLEGSTHKRVEVGRP